MIKGTVPVQGTVPQQRKRMRLGFSSEDFGYSISLGLPPASSSYFSLDPEIKREAIWAGGSYRLASSLVDRNGSLIKVRDASSWKVIAKYVKSFDSLFTQVADTSATPEVVQMRENIKSWRFYDGFNTDANSPARSPQLGTRTPVLNHDGCDLAAALQTIKEIGDADALNEAIADAFPGSRVEVVIQAGGLFVIEFYQHGLLRPLSGAELSDGTLRYLLLVAALLTPRAPPLMVLNEPENSLHPDLLPALARLIIKASEQTQVWVVSHSNRLVYALNQSHDCHAIELVKQLGQTKVVGQGMLDEPSWHWLDK
jgi:predicted ATPase